MGYQVPPPPPKPKPNVCAYCRTNSRNNERCQSCGALVIASEELKKETK